MALLRHLDASLEQLLGIAILVFLTTFAGYRVGNSLANRAIETLRR